MAHDIRNGYQIVQKWDNWALLDKGTNESRWIAAHYPHYDKDGNITSWEHGHYYNDLFAAVSCIEENINTAKIIKIDQNVLMDNTFLPYKSNSEEPDPDPDPDI